jgi:NAD(P)-dependent dehydrogenase (short-subunit alcohol dehydrogenase family)
MPASCEGRIAIVTGASRGMGQAFACRLAAEGARVAVVGRGAARRNTELAGSLDETVELVAGVAGPASVLAVNADLGDPDEDKGRIVAETENAFGAPPDILVHSAAAPREFGAGRPLVAFAETPREWFIRSVEVNVWGFWDFAVHMIPGMRRQGAGWLLAISSRQAAPRPTPADGAAGSRLGGACIYGGTKAFIDRVVTGAAQELYGYNIACNALSPTGPVRTPLSATVTPELKPEDWEPMETMVEAGIALCTGDPRRLTSRIAYSLPLLVELGRPVHTLDGAGLFDGWQPDRDDPRLDGVAYLSGH